MALEPIPGQPGLFRDPAGDPNDIINIRDFREGDKYDTIAIPTGIIQAGQQFQFFQNIQGKLDVDCNLRTPSKLSAGESMILDRIGLAVRSSTGLSFPAPQDYKSVIENSFYQLLINRLIQDEGPSIKFPSGYGFYGHTNENGQGIVSIGVPATASAARMVKKQLLNQNHELQGLMTFQQRNWLTQGAQAPFTPVNILPSVTVQSAQQTPVNVALLVTNYLHGLIRVAVSK